MLAKRGASDEQVAAHLESARRGMALWAELAARGPTALLTWDGVVDVELDGERRHPYVLHRRDGEDLLKLDVLAAFPADQRGAVLGRMKRDPAVEALKIERGSHEHPLPARELIEGAMRDAQKARLVFRTGHAITTLPRRGSSFEYLVEIRGGAPMVVFRHGLYAVEPIAPPKPDAAGGGRGGKKKKGRRGKKKGKRGR